MYESSAALIIVVDHLLDYRSPPSSTLPLRLHALAATPSISLLLLASVGKIQTIRASSLWIVLPNLLVEPMVCVCCWLWFSCDFAAAKRSSVILQNTNNNNNNNASKKVSIDPLPQSPVQSTGTILNSPSIGFESFFAFFSPFLHPILGRNHQSHFNYHRSYRTPSQQEDLHKRQ